MIQLLRSFSFLQLTFCECFLVITDSFQKTKVMVRIVVTLDSVGAWFELNAFSIWQVHVKRISFLTVVRHSKSLCNLIEAQNIRQRLLVMPYFAVVFEFACLVRREHAAICVQCQTVPFLFDAAQKFSVAENVG